MDTDDNSHTEREIPESDPDVIDWRDAIHTLDSERPSSDSLYLNKSDIDDILGESDSYDEFDQDDADEILADIETRLMRLLYDIALLSYGGYLDDIDKIWDHLEESPDHMNLALRKAIERDTQTSNNDFCFDLGFNTGLAFSEITGTTNEDDRGERFLEGFTQAYSAELFRYPDDLIEESEYSPAIINNIEVPTRVAENTPDDITRNDSSDTSVTQSEVFSRYNISSTEYLRELIWMSQQAINNELPDSDASLGKVTKIFIESQDDWFNKCCEVRRGLDEEWESIDDAGVPGPDVETVLESLWALDYKKENIKISSKNIRDDFGGKKGYKTSVTQILNQLSENGKNPSKSVVRTFEHNEIVSYDDGWELTDYGRLLFYHVFEKNQSPQWIHETSLQMTLPYDVGDRWSDQDVNILEQGVDEFFTD